MKNGPKMDSKKILAAVMAVVLVGALLISLAASIFLYV